MTSRLTGKVTNRLSGYGFIRVDDRDYFFHKSEVKDGFFNAIEEGMEAEFTPDYDCPKGPLAKEVSIV